MSRYDGFAGGTGPGAFQFRSGHSARYDHGWSPGFRGGPGREENFGPHRRYGVGDGAYRSAETSRIPMRSNETPTAVWMNDHDVRRAVLQALSEDRWLDSSSIVVQVRDGVVLLDGEVNDYLEARYAWDDTWECIGVRGVLNRLDVRSSEQPE